MIKDKFFTKSNLNFLEKYINTSSPTGYEIEEPGLDELHQKLCR